MKRVLVTGANGFIGRHSLFALMERGYEVHGLLLEGDTGLPIPGVEWHTANLLAPGRISSLVKSIQPSHLLHFAWYTDPGIYWNSSKNLRWLQASLELLLEFKAYGGRRVTMAGTCAEYDWRYGYCSEQVTPLEPATLYGTCKNALQKSTAMFARQEGISAAWGRIFFLYGPHEHPVRLVPSVINALCENQPALCTHGEQIRDFLYVKDVGTAFAALLDSEVEGATNIASGEPVAIKDMVLRIAEKVGRPDLIRLGAIATLPNEPSLLVGDASRIKQETGWVPQYTLDTGLNETIDWWRDQVRV